MKTTIEYLLGYFSNNKIEILKALQTTGNNYLGSTINVNYSNFKENAVQNKEIEILVEGKMSKSKNQTLNFLS